MNDRKKIHIVPPVYTAGRSFYDLSGTARYMAPAHESTRRWLQIEVWIDSKFPAGRQA